MLSAAHKASKEAEDSSFAGLWQEAVGKYRHSAELFRKAALSANPQSRPAIESLAQKQEEKAEQLLKQVEAARSGTPGNDSLVDSTILQQPANFRITDPSVPSSSPCLVAPNPTRPLEGMLHNINYIESLSKSIEPKIEDEEVPEDTEFTWDGFWASVDDLLGILPKPLFEEAEDPMIKIRAPDVPERSNSPSVDDFFIVPNEPSAPPQFMPIRKSGNIEGHTYNTLLEELNAKNKENQLLKNRILMFRQQLKFKVSRLRQFQAMPPKQTGSVLPKESATTGASKLLIQKDEEIAALKRQIEDRDKFIAEQREKIARLEERWENLKRSAKLKKSGQS